MGFLVFFRDLFQGAIKILSVFPDDGVPEKNIRRHLQPLALHARGMAKGFARFVVEDLARLRPARLDRIKMATDRLFPIGLAFIPGLFDTTFDHSVCVLISISTHLAFDRGRDPAELPVVLISPVRFDRSYSGGSQIGLDLFIDPIQPVQFILFQGGARVAVFTAPAPAFQKITNELLLDYLITDQYIIYCYHGDQLCAKYNLFPGVLPFEGVNEVRQVDREEIVDDR